MLSLIRAVVATMSLFSNGTVTKSEVGTREQSDAVTGFMICLLEEHGRLGTLD